MAFIYAIFAGNTLSCMRSNEMYGFQPPSPPILARLAMKVQVDGLGRFRLGWRARQNPYISFDLMQKRWDFAKLACIVASKKAFRQGFAEKWQEFEVVC